MSGAVGLAAVVVLAVVFATAGVAKVIDSAGTREAVVAFGVPQRLSVLGAVLVPLAELTVAILLIIPRTRIAGAAGSLVLLSLLSAAVAVSLARGRAPECQCFGQLHSAPASWKTLARNGLLAGLGVIALTVTPASLAGSEVLPAAGALATVAVLAACVLGYVSLLRSQGRLLLRLDAIERGLAQAGIGLEAQAPAMPSFGPAPGAAAPDFTAVDETGTTVSLDDLLASGLPLLLAFTSPDCGPCRTLVPTLAAWQRDHAERLTVAVVTTDPGAETRAHGLARVLADDDLTVYGLYEANGTPSAVLVSADATIASHVAQGVDAIVRLVDEALAEPLDVDEPGLPVGAPIPEVSLVGLDGQATSLIGDAEDATLLLFWNPDCGFCGSMRDELLAWEQGPPRGAPRLVVLSSGDEDATRADGFASAVVLDPGMVVGSAFGATGTPMAVMLDSRGVVASPLVAGAAAVLALAGPPGARSGRVGI